MILKIGYFADGQWAHEAFDKIIADATIQIKFVAVRFSTRDPILIEKAKQNNIPVEIEKNINSPGFVEKMRRYGADLFVSMSFDQIFKEEMINLPRYKTINCHAGKLPFYRGRNVLNWVLINDEDEFGITVHYLDNGIDTGDIILQEVFPITDDDDYSTLLNRSYAGCAEILYKAIKMIQQGTVKSIPQATIDKVGMYCGRRQAGDEVINWSQTSREIFNFIRALCAPGPQATSWVNGKKISINRARLVPEARPYKNIEGMIVGKTEQGFLVKTKDTFLEIIEYSYEGKIRIGDRLKSNE